MRDDVAYTGSREPHVAGPSEVLRIEPGGRQVAINPRNDLVNHSPAGLSWGYAGSGPAQCALALLADYFEDNDEAATRLHQYFKDEVVAGFGDQWILTGREIGEWLNGQGKYQHLDKLRPRQVRSVEPSNGGFDVVLDPCGHMVWFAVAPGKSTFCGACLSEVAEALREARK